MKHHPQRTRLSHEQALELAKRSYRNLASLLQEIPRQDEREPAYTARVIAPIVRAHVQKYAGVVMSGDGATSARTISFLGRPHRPDMILTVDQVEVMAIEVKFLRSSGRQNAVATALGQASIYKLADFAAVAVCLIDLESTSDIAIGEREKYAFASMGIVPLIFKRRRNNLVNLHA